MYDFVIAGAGVSAASFAAALKHKIRYVYCELDNPVPFYPVNTKRNKKILDDLKGLIKFQYPKLELLGRLGTYKYIDIHQAVGQALSLAKKYKE